MIVGLLVLGIMLMASGLKGTEHKLGQQITNDLLGTDGFIGWIAAFGAIGAIGYIPKLEQPSRYLMALMLVVIVLRNGGVFQQFQAALQTAAAQGPAVSAPAPVTALDSGGGSSSGGSSSGGGIGSALGSIGGIVSGIASIF
jgi:hypothetical protein